MGLTGITFADMNAAFADIAKTGATTVRTWYIVLYIISTLNSGADLIFLETNVYYDCRGFNEITSASSNGATTNYYQIWSSSTPTINTGLTGLQNFGLFRAFDQTRISVTVCLLTETTFNR